MERSESTGAMLREVARLHTQLQRSCVEYCSGTTVTQCTLLTELGRRGTLTLAALSRHLQLDKGWVSRAVEQMVQEGLVEKVPSSTDRRTVLLSLSEQGQHRLAALNQSLNGLAEQVMHHIPEAEHRAIQQALSLLLGALADELAQVSQATDGDATPSCSPC
jgi:DNA-binding MarR family transcriptional regulator